MTPSPWRYDSQMSAVCEVKADARGLRRIIASDVADDVGFILAAAPLMLKALEEAHLSLLNIDDSYAGSSVCNRNQDLIDKAKGETK